MTLQQLDPMFVDFYLPQQALGQIEIGQKVEVTADAWPGRMFPGKIDVAESEGGCQQPHDPGAGDIPNADGALLPGMFVNVSIVTGQPQPLVTIPLAAVALQSVRLAGLRRA